MSLFKQGFPLALPWHPKWGGESETSHFVLICASWVWPRCELFDQNLKLALEVAEKAGTFGPGS